MAVKTSHVDEYRHMQEAIWHLQQECAKASALAFAVCRECYDTVFTTNNHFNLVDARMYLDDDANHRYLGLTGEWAGIAFTEQYYDGAHSDGIVFVVPENICLPRNEFEADMLKQFILSRRESCTRKEEL